ncbi:polyprotein [Noni mosaic virus]|uniref:Genome polyprotein n=1 Tax=Noni mosaic virus TaxID=2608606 RepID=A0A5J6DDR9_9POTV|nr:polyprotein [Noni mosaic virus]QER90702.1 polyprotein [Noni mosaic virus]
MAAIYFGQFVSPVLHGNINVLHAINCRSTKVVAKQPLIVREESVLHKLSVRMINDYDSNVHAAFKSLEANLASHKPRYELSRVVTTKSGFTKLVKPTKAKIERVLKARFNRVRERNLFLGQPDYVITTITPTLVDTPLGGSEPEKQVKPLHKTPKVKKTRRPDVVNLSEKKFEALLLELSIIAKERQIPLEMVSTRRRAHKAYFSTYKGATLPKVELKHEKGVRVPHDVDLDYIHVKLLKSMLRISQLAKGCIQLEPGSSGFVFCRGWLTRNHVESEDNTVIVMGLLDDTILDARKRTCIDDRARITYYSNPALMFWKGFDSYFQKFKPVDIQHTCESAFDVEKCGAVAAIICQTIMPCGKITCKHCAADNMRISKREQRDRQRKIGIANEMVIRQQFGEFVQASSFLEQLRESIDSVNDNFEAFSTTRKLLSGRLQNHFRQLDRLNELVIKGCDASSEELFEASNLILELARYMVNRTENIKKGDLQHFRNKVSAKAQINPALLCDNQLDKNGNFVWGERGYHAKRFFSNYFEKINPARGYSDYQIRLVPNGSRKLAIGNLIVSTNLATLREQMQGEPVAPMPLSRSCTSKLNDNYVYTCCCVTHDDGQPLLSDVKMPTKNHLVIGNSGDPKYVDLPTDISDQLYIAKQGYCYVNIFLAMLVNVNEGDAKNFTKMARDIVINKLGQWPSMMDVATSCYLLTVFYPETKSAELPRILVDHHSKSMHVIDSYGSISTGYHVLKANSVAQLIHFASDALDSEMKHYVVGGEKLMNEASAMSVLIKSIYRPKLMEKVLSEEPYLITLSLLSPGLIMALHNSGALEKATHLWIQHDSSITLLFSMLSTLAHRVSIAESCLMQMAILEQEAASIYECIVSGFRPQASYITAINVLNKIMARGHADESIYLAGFRPFRMRSVELIEKNYLAELEDSWRELTWLEKFSSIKESHKWRPAITNVCVPKKRADLGGRYDVSIQLLLGKVKESGQKHMLKCRENITSCFRTVRRRMVTSLTACAYYCVPDILKLINVLLVLSLLCQIAYTINSFSMDYKKTKQMACEAEDEKNLDVVLTLYDNLSKKLKVEPTFEEFKAYLEAIRPDLIKYLPDEYQTEHQASRGNNAKYEQLIAFVALILMVFDADKSDCVYRILNKLKSLTGTLENSVKHESLDEIKDEFSERNEIIDIDLSGEVNGIGAIDCTFEQWWTKQLELNRVVPHYRIGGEFVEFTRATAELTVSRIVHSSAMEFLVRGAVGSGKSTGLPNALSAHGKVLVLEATRPLAENVCKQLRGNPFFKSPTLRMRGHCSFGSSPIVVMTTGYALHLFAHNVQQLSEYDFILLDECHVLDSAATAFYCMLKEFKFKGKLLKVSATPPGRECDFSTQYPVTVNIEEQLSFKNFVSAQGTGSNADVTSKGDNILVYVASYNEVDHLSLLLTEAKFMVTKVDGRSMKVGAVEIKTRGTSENKHFVVATNIIENGVTLDIDVVVDFGLKVVPELDPDNRMITYKKVAVNYGERIQRLGRVGRTKPGHALRVGYTEKGLEWIPPIIATEAAFLCFAYGLPVVANGVTTSLITNCTVRQARTMMSFELPLWYTIHMVRFDGSVHPEINRVLKPFKLRDSEIPLNTLAIPSSGVNNWMKVSDLVRLGQKLTINEKVKIPFISKDIPETLHEKVWQVVLDFKSDAGFGRLTSHNACAVSYALRTDPHALPRTVKILDALIAEEMRKQAHFRSISSYSFAGSGFSLASITNAIKARYSVDHTGDNIRKLQLAKAQICEFSSTHTNIEQSELLEPFGALNLVQHQSKGGVAQVLGLKGIWKKELITTDVLVALGVLGGGCWLLYEMFKDSFREGVQHQAFNKRQRQKLKFRNTNDQRLGREVYGEDADLEQVFGAAYTKKGKSKGKTHGMGKKTRRFINMYGFDPTEYNLVRFVDPITGHTIDEQPVHDINLVQEQLSEVRRFLVAEDEIDPNQLVNSTIHAYFIKNKSKNALKVDLTPHNPLKVCDRSATIAGFPEREFELRQTGLAQPVKLNEVPGRNELEIVDHESKSLLMGLKDHNPIAASVCKISNASNGENITLFGVGFGPYIITNQHIMRQNNGELKIQSRHGNFTIKNSCNVPMKPFKGRDILLIKMPKDFPPFPQKLKFRSPKSNEKAIMVGSNFQEKYFSSTVSEASPIFPVADSHFWKHWISTKDGYCGLPLVSTGDGFILGLHSLANCNNTANYMATFPDDFESEILNQDTDNWVKHWRYNPDEVLWGTLHLHNAQPKEPFKASKLIMDLFEDSVCEQSRRNRDTWMFDALEGNLKAVARCDSQLVTKHVVKGKDTLFEEYLSLHIDAEEFFRPLMGKYQKSRLNKQAYQKDLLKYARTIEVGTVDIGVFETALQYVIDMMIRKGFQECNYVTDSDEIFQALNMKSAVGALYHGKKRDYFEGYTEQDKENIIRESCFRVFSGKMGVWNGSLKAELRPLEKTLLNKTRSFTAAPIDTLLAGKVCVDDFNNQFYSLNLHCPWTVGMTKFYRGWDTLMRKLPDGWIYCDADGSQFDSSLTPFLINAVILIREKFMEEWDVGHIMLKNLYTEILYTPIATPDGTIVKKFKGNNSGQPSTVVDNTLMVIVTMVYALMKQSVTEVILENIIVFYVNGDDLLIAIHPEFEYLLDKMQGCFLDLGLNYDFSSRTRNKEELWYMSHRALEVNGLYIPKLEPERIVSILEWDRADLPEHRMEAICAAMIEAWGYDELLHHIRRYYSWLLEQMPFKLIAQKGHVPYIAESALHHLYTNAEVENGELLEYYKAFLEDMILEEEVIEKVVHQADTESIDAGQKPADNKQKTIVAQTGAPPAELTTSERKDKDINAGTSGTFSIPRLKQMASRMSVPKIGSRPILNLQHLVTYTPEQVNLSNTRATQSQLNAWYEAVKAEYGVNDDEMSIILNGLVVWCIENGTSPNLSGMWVMMDGDVQVEYPLKPVLENAKPTFRQIMAHFSNIAEAYIEKRNSEKPYMPRYGLQRNLTDMSLARYAFDFFEMTSKTPNRAREAHIQMKAAAVRSSSNRLFGLDGNVTNEAEDTERHTADDVNRNMHSLLGVRQM